MFYSIDNYFDSLPQVARYERKFDSGYINKDIVYFIKMHPMLFREIYCKRRVNNIYYDTMNYKNYLDNVEGNQYRLKVRIRWYGSNPFKIFDPVLEIKIKN